MCFTLSLHILKWMLLDAPNVWTLTIFFGISDSLDFYYLLINQRVSSWTSIASLVICAFPLFCFKKWVFFLIFDQLSVCCLYPLIFWKQNRLFKSAYMLGKENWFIEPTRLNCHDIALKSTTKRCTIIINIVHISFALSLQSSSLEVKKSQCKQQCYRKK